MNPLARKTLSEIVAPVSEILALYLFGSQARGDARKGSDVDLALLLNPKVNADRAWRLRLEMADRFSRALDGKPVDVVILGEDLDLSFRVLREGERMFERDHDEVCYREATIASMYYDYKVAERFRKVGS